MKSLFAATIIAVASVGTAASAFIVDIPAVNPANATYTPTPITLPFDPGTYTAQVVGRAGGGVYDAWGVATPAAGNYDNRYNITYGGNTTNVNPYGGQRFAAATDALDAFSGILTSFTLATAGNVAFSIPDTFWYDNTGGVSLNVTKMNAPAPVPEPATMALFALGGGALLARSRRRKATSQA